ncbi:MAG TPA: hypothetical protein VGD58_27850 [Herpetosiphonaceae bacterium]
MPEMFDPNVHLLAPEVALSNDKLQYFEALYQAALASPSKVVEYTCEYPKHEFLQYLVTHHHVILHGSTNSAIDLFQTQRASLDTTTQGSLSAIYATTDPIWPMYFAILDWRVYRGSSRNGVQWVQDAHGAIRKVYYFSLNQDMLPRQPWTKGIIYILPRLTFEQLRDDDGELTEEWASYTPVVPLARLPVTPDDFPFLNDIAGHDDSDTLRLGDLLVELFQGCQQAHTLGDGYALMYNDITAWWPKITEFVPLWRATYPWTVLELRLEANHQSMWLFLRGSTTLQAVLERKCGKYLPQNSSNDKEPQ